MENEMRKHIDSFRKHITENKKLDLSGVSGSLYGIDDKWIEIWNEVKHMDLNKMDWIDIIVLLGREFNPPTKRQ
jgi:hypothetical protein